MQCGSGGPVVDHDGNIIGIAFNINPGPVVISITTIRTCIEMWHQFRSVSFFFLTIVIHILLGLAKKKKRNFIVLVPGLAKKNIL